MPYRITGLSPAPFTALFGLNDIALAKHGAVRVTASSDKGWPCRVSLKDAKAGEQLILINHVSHDVATPYMSAYAVYICEGETEIAEFLDQVPPVFEGRSMAFRAFDADGMLRAAALALPGDADRQICSLFENENIAYIHAHNAAHGCFSAKIERA